MMPDSPNTDSSGPAALPRRTEGPLVFISAAEPSADAHGAALIRAVRRRRPGVRFAGVAGPIMQSEGCWPIFDMTRHAAMLLGVVKALPQAMKLLTTTRRHLKKYPFAAAVVIDSPTLNLPIARQAKRHMKKYPRLYKPVPTSTRQKPPT